MHATQPGAPRRPIDDRRRPLVDALATVCAREGAEALIDDALAEAGHGVLPSTNEEVLAFVRRHLLSRVADALGALGAATFLATLLGALEGEDDRAAAPAPPAPADGVPATVRITERAPRRRIVVVSASPSERQRLARAFVRVGHDVRVVERVADLVEVERSGGPAATAVVAVLGSDEALATVRAVVARVPGVYLAAVVAGDADRVAETSARLRAAGLPQFEVFSSSLPSSGLVAAVEAAVAVGPAALELR